MSAEGWLVHAVRVLWATKVEPMKVKFRCSFVWAYPQLRLEMGTAWNLYHPPACMSFSGSLTCSLGPSMNRLGR